MSTPSHSILLFTILLFFITIDIIHSRPYLKISQQIPKNEIYAQLYISSCGISNYHLSNYGHFGGYSIQNFLSSVKSICIDVEENGKIETQMKESNMELNLEDPLKSAQYIWTISRLKYEIYLLEHEAFKIWTTTLLDLKLINQADIPVFHPEYQILIRSRPKKPGVQIPIRIFPNMDDILIILSLVTQHYRKGKFATDFTGGKKPIISDSLKKNATPLIQSNIDYYVPILTKLYPPSFDYKNLISSVSFVYRMIYYCTGNIIKLNEAWEIWAQAMPLGGGGTIPEYDPKYKKAILTQNPEDKFPEERNFMVVLEKLTQLQDPSWNVLFPPMYSHRKDISGGIENHELFKFMELKGFSFPNKNSKDIEGIVGVYFILHYILKIFISIETAVDLWVTMKAWLTISSEYYSSNKIFFVQYKGHKRNRSELDQNEVKPKWATGNRHVNAYSEIVNTFLTEFENDFPYIITCPDGELALKEKNSQDIRYKFNPYRNQKSDRLAVNIAKEIHRIAPSIKFRSICDLASSFYFHVPFSVKLSSRYRVKKKSKDKINKSRNIWKFEDNYIGMDYCKKGIINLFNDSNIEFDLQDPGSLIKHTHINNACSRIIKTQVKCSINLPYYFPYYVTNVIDTFAGNLAAAMSTSFTGEPKHYFEVIGTIWDGKTQSMSDEETIPSLFRLHNPAFNPENLCKISEVFVIPAIVNYFEQKNLLYLNKLKKSRKKSKSKLVLRIKQRYFNKKNVYNERTETFYSDLISLKRVVNAHKIPKGANLEDWKDFIIDENSISTLILSQFKKLADFISLCKTTLEEQLRNGAVQFHPQSSDINLYRAFLLDREKRSRLFFNKLMKDDQRDHLSKEITNKLIFRDEALGSFPETIASHLRDIQTYNRFDLQSKSSIQWYLEESCEKAADLIYSGVPKIIKEKCTRCHYSDCYEFLVNSSNNKIEFEEDPKPSVLRLVEESLEFGLKIITQNLNFKLGVSRVYYRDPVLEDLEKIGVKQSDDLLDSHFIIKNASFLYIYLMCIYLPISKEKALLVSKIASILLRNYFLHGVIVNEENVTVSPINLDPNMVGKLSHFGISSKVGINKIIPFYCDKNNERVIELHKTLVLSGNYIPQENNNFSLRRSYITKATSCKIVKELFEEGIINEDYKEYEVAGQVTNCLNYVASKFFNLPHMAIPTCTSQRIIVECGQGSNYQNTIASIMLSSFPKYGIYKDMNSFKNFSCNYSKYVILLYNVQDFFNNCLNSFNGIFNFKEFIHYHFPNMKEMKQLEVLENVCNNLNILHSCEKETSNPYLRKETERVSNIILSEISNEFSDLDIFWEKNILCKAAGVIVRNEFEDCITTVEEILKLINYQFSADFGKSICIKLNIWPRRCDSENFADHSLLSNVFYRYILVPLINDNSLNEKREIKDSNFEDICLILAEKYSLKNYISKVPVISTTGIDPTSVCEEYFDRFIIEKTEVKTIEQIQRKRDECKSIASSKFLEVAKDKMIFTFFESNSEFSSTVPFLPSYMSINGIAERLINLYKLPPRITLMTIGLHSALDLLNSKKSENNKHKFSLLGILYNSIKMVTTLDNPNTENYYIYCVNINKERIIPEIDENDLKQVCFNTMIAFENPELNDNIYLLYSLNNKVSSYYTTTFTSENILYTPKLYLSKILRGEPSLNLQKVYENVLNFYINYIFTTGFISFTEDPTGSSSGKSEFKRLNSNQNPKGKFPKCSKKEEKHTSDDALLSFLQSSSYTIDLSNDPKIKLLKVFAMFNLLLETKRLGVVQTHFEGKPFEIERETNLNSIVTFMPPDLANWLTSGSNYLFVGNLFVVPIESEGNHIIGPFGNMDIENEILYESLSKEGLVLDRNMNFDVSKQKLLNGDKKIQISSSILISTIIFLFEQYNSDRPINYSFTIENNPYLFRNTIKKLKFNLDVSKLSYEDNYKKFSIGKNSIALDAINYFLENSPSKIMSESDFFLSSFDFLKNFNIDSMLYFNGDLNSPEMKNIRRRIFCRIFNDEILRNTDKEGNPLFKCFYIQESSSIRNNKHIEGKTTKVCTFTGRATEVDEFESYYLLREYLKFFSGKNEIHNQLNSDSLKLAPEIIIRGIGRIFGYCLLVGEPINLFFNNFMFRHLGSGDEQSEVFVKDSFDPRIDMFRRMIAKSYLEQDSKKFSKEIMNFESAKKRVNNGEEIYYIINNEKNRKIGLEKNNLSDAFKVRNFNNLRFLKKMIGKNITYEGIKIEVDNFVKGVFDFIPRRFLRSFSNVNLFFYVQGYLNTVVKNESVLKSLLTSYFTIENSELLMGNKRKLIRWFFIALNSLPYHEIGFFFSTFTNNFNIFLPTAYIGKIRIMDIPLEDERNPERRIIIDSLLLTIYVPNYNSYIDIEQNIWKIIEGNKKKLLKIV
ncbi:HECT domain-containing family protein [Cryptosporidium felis]|nr:HECT domain-containing family protein [Cryptosporidium felis]